MNPSQDATDIWVALNLAQRSVYQAIESALKAKGFAPLRWYDVLWELEKSPDGMRPYELEQRLIFEQSNLSRLLGRMRDEGLVEAFTYPNDARGKVLRITAKGRRLRQQMWQTYGPMIEEKVGEVAKAHDTHRLIQALRALIVSP